MYTDLPHVSIKIYTGSRSLKYVDTVLYKNNFKTIIKLLECSYIQ
jgi:hypothetical protein